MIKSDLITPLRHLKPLVLTPCKVICFIHVAASGPDDAQFQNMNQSGARFLKRDEVD